MQAKDRTGIFIITTIYHANFYFITDIPLTLYPRRGSRGISEIPSRHPRFTTLATRNAADVTGGKPIAVRKNRKMGGVALALPFVVSNCSYTYIIPKRQQRHLRYSSDMPTFYHNYSAMINTADMW
jgi:hypothetical protein